MGMFSSSKETVVGTAAMHCLDVNNLGNPIGDAVIEAVLTSGVPHASLQDIPGRLIQSNLNAFHIKVDRAYDYARDHYTLGLPSGAQMALPTIRSSDIKPYILNETEYPHDILITDHEYTPYTPMISIAAFLKNTRQYNPLTDSVGVWPPGTVFTQHWGEDISSFAKRVSILSVEVLPDGLTARITYQKHIQRPVIVTDTSDRYSSYIELQWTLDGTVIEDVVIPGATVGMAWNDDCLFVLYKRIDAGGVVLPTTYSWVYHLNEGLYPELHPDIEQDISTFMPVIPIRYDNKDLTRPSETELYTTSKKLMELLGNNLEAMGNQLNANPSIADIDHAYIMFGVNIQTQFVPSIFYLTDYFYQLSKTQRGSESSFLAALADPDTAFKEYGLALDVQYDYIKTWLTTEVIGAVGHATKNIQSYVVSYTHTNYGSGDTTDGQPYTTIETRYKLVLTAQINSYQTRTVEVYNLRVTNWIYGKHHVITTLDQVRRDSDENGLIIPIQYQLSRQVFDDSNIKIRDQFYSDTMMIIINSIDRIKVKWYEKSWFRFVLIIVVTVLTFWAGGFGGALVAAVNAGVAAFIQFAAVTILVSLAISYAVKWVVRNYGEQIGILGAMVLMVLSLVASKGAGMFGQASQFMLTTSQALLQVSTALISATNEFLVEQAEEIRNDFQIFTEKMDGLWKELEEIQDLLAWKADLDPLTFTKPERLKILPNETPTVFFNRCLGLVDNTMFTIHDEIPNFMDMRLRHTKDIPPEMYRLNSYS